MNETAIQSAANTANAVMGIYGISGSGKSSLADTGAEEAYETFGAITLCYAADLGGFGNKRLTLIRHGIMRVWDPRNHVNPFETMELMSLGAFPERLIDPERGYADPNVKLILPRRSVWIMYCPQGHQAHVFEDQRQMQVTQVKCPTCAMQTGVSNASKVVAASLKHPMFERVGLRIYDSFTSLNEWGMADLQEQSARGLLPASSQGGAALGSADALRSGQFVFGTSSRAQYGFLQNRTYGWLSNIKTIPDQVMPAIATFMVEQSKGDDESGGEMLYGPKIAGNARTSALGGWLGHLLHATKEPFTQDVGAPLVYRLWLTNHIDPRDVRKIPYIAKHRGTPLGMPDYLEDAPSAPAWSGCSLRIFYKLQREQLAALEAEAKSKYPDAPGMWTGENASTASTQQEGRNETQTTIAPSTPTNIEPAAPVVASRGRRRVGAAVAQTPVIASSPAPENAPPMPAVVTPTTAVADAGTSAPEIDTSMIPSGDSPIVRQLKESLAAAGAATERIADRAPNGSAQTPPATSVVAPAASNAPAQPVIQSATAPRVRRVARPPV